MKHSNRLLVRAATAIRAELVRATSGLPAARLPTEEWQTIVRLSRQISAAQRRGFARAVRALAGELVNHAERLQSELRTAATAWYEFAHRREPPTVANVYRELWALQDQFAGFACDSQAGEVSVHTAAIELDGVDLGPFEIRLNWEQLERANYRVISLEPNRASSDSCVTHPHVKDEQLCEGEGRVAIQRALSEGRLYDFFELVTRILHTYSQGSAYVEVADWHNQVCSDCDAEVSQRYACACDYCESTLCEDCQRRCQECETALCNSCSTVCRQCQADCCASCRATCSACGISLCPSCLSESRCLTCAKEGTSDHDDKCEAQAATFAGPVEVATGQRTSAARATV